MYGVCMYICMYIRMYIRIYVYMCVCKYYCVCMCTCICNYMLCMWKAIIGMSLLMNSDKLLVYLFKLKCGRAIMLVSKGELKMERLR